MEPEVNTAAGDAASPPGLLHNGGSSSHDSVGSRPSRDELQHSPPPAQHPDGNGKKRRTGPGSRGVANLTPEQLAKKRANDREAQRAIRERTKLQIESLERRIAELTSQQPYQELQATIRAKEAVEAENAEIKRRLASVVAMIQPMLLPQQEQQPVYPSPSQTFVPVSGSAPPAPPSLQNVSTPTSAASPASIEPHGQWLAGSVSGAPPAQPQGQAFTQTKMLDQQRHDLLHGLDLGAERLGLDFLLGPSQRIARIQNGVNGAQDTPGFNRPWTGVGQVMNTAFNQGAGVPRLEYASDGMTPTADNLAGYSAPIKNCPPTCPLDSLLLDFLHERRQRAAEGLPAQDIIGPKYPSVSSLLNPMSGRFSHPLSKVFTDILQTFPDLSRLPERVAVLYIMFLIMRWQISPTQENYDRLPEWMTPRPSQLFTPHPAWIDHLPFPRMREKLVRDYGPAEFPFENFFIPFTTTLSLNWPYEDTDTLLQSPESDELMINPVFERHLRRLENWSLGDAFAKAFPGLADTYNLKSEGQERRR